MNFFNALKYNAFDDIPQDLKGKFSSVIIDPLGILITFLYL